MVNDATLEVGTLDQWTADVLAELFHQRGLLLQFQTNTKRSTQCRATVDASLGKHARIELSVILYGPMEYFDAVGDFLCKCNLYLQDPGGCDRNVRYRNPQSLWGLDDNDVRMTQDATVNVKCDIDVFQNSSDLLEGLEYGHELPEAPQPSALKTPLHRSVVIDDKVRLVLKDDRHQKQALTFMVRRELGWSFREDDLWRTEQDQMGETLCDLISAAKILMLTSAFSYVHVATGEQQFEQPQEFRGGIIGDQMGLGKSLSIIALIARDKDDLGHNMLLDSRSDVQSTLIIVRAPRELRCATY
jgi:hypothetical protein